MTQITSDCSFVINSHIVLYDQKRICLGTNMVCLVYFILFFFGKYLFIYLLIYLAAPGLSCGMQDLHCHVQDLLVAACGISSCSMQDLVLWPGLEPRPPALGAWSLSHWTTREVPVCLWFGCSRLDKGAFTSKDSYSIVTLSLNFSPIFHFCALAYLLTLT